ncbi:hypothetical protein [Pseudothermotoga sp.]|nr:hypothetical protein [Pseudothermotoga sp.]MCX7812156.1 hypothetical protein [Pseudothermotoga sp.]MDW8139226.1 hypothetical protein [Pseudothermotoga sp.]
MKTLLYLSLLIGVFWSAFGLLLLIGYSLLGYVSPLLNDFFNVTVRTSKWFLAFSLFSLCSGLCTCLYSIARASGGNHMIFLSFAFASSAFSIAVQIYRMVVSGLGWFAVDLLGAYGDLRPIQLLSIGLLILSLILFSFQFSLIRLERTRL